VVYTPHVLVYSLYTPYEICIIQMPTHAGKKLRAMLPRRIKAPLRRAIDSTELLPFLHVPPVKTLVMVTGADSSHFLSLKQFLTSIYQHEQFTHVLAYDLGLTPSEHEDLRLSFPQVEVRVFDYSKYPDYFNIRVNAGEYAWKPVIVSDAIAEFQCPVCWLDAGTVITRRLLWLRKIVNGHGMYSPRSAGTIRDWTHQLTLDNLQVPPALYHKHNVSGGIVATNNSREDVVSLIHRWKECALEKKCIAPEGSNRRNHRQDQAVLTALVHMSGLADGMPLMLYGFKAQQDIE